MTPPISSDVKKQLEKLYYSESNFFGRDRLFKLARERYRCIKKAIMGLVKNSRNSSALYAFRRK